MNRKLSPKSVESAVHDAVYGTVWWAVYGPVHPNIDKFIEETEQNWSAP